MARSITFGGQTQFRPGGLTRINASALTPIGPTATGIIGLLGEADGGQPGVAIVIDDPVLAKSTFRSGPLADAIRLAFNPSNDPRIPAGAFRVVAYKVNQSTQGALQVPGAVSASASGPGADDTVAAGTTATVVNLTTGGLTASVVGSNGLVTGPMVGRFIKIFNDVRRIISNSASAITLEKALSAVPANGSTVQFLNTAMILIAQDYGSHTNQVAFEQEPGVVNTLSFIVTLEFGTVVEQSPELGGISNMNVMYVGGPVTDTGTVTAATTSTITATMGTTPTLNQYANQKIILPDGSQRKILSNTAASPSLITLAAGHSITTAQAAGLVGQVITVKNVTAAIGNIVGASGVAASLTTTVTMVPSSTADNLTLTFLAGETLRQFATRVNATTNFRVSIPSGLNPDVILMKSFDFGAANTSVDVNYDTGITPPVNTPNEGAFRRDLQAVMDWINNFSELATAVRGSQFARDGQQQGSVTGGSSAVVGDSVLYFAGGIRGISANSNWQDGMDAMLEERMNHIVPLISQDLVNEGFGSTATFAAVAAQLSAHEALAATTAKNEQGGYLGMQGTRAQLIAQAHSLNNTDIMLTPQKFTCLDVDGNLKLLPEWSGAVIAAGMRSGAPEVGEPLTFKAIKCSGFTNDSSWSPRDVGDINALIQAGVMFAEQTPAGVIRWVRDITTYITDDNIVFMDGNMREEVRFMAYDLRTGLEDTFTGLKAKPANVASMREYVAAKMAIYKTNNLITPSLDENGVLVPDGFRKLRVFIDGNVATIRVEIYPVAGIVFELNDIILQLPRLAA